MNIAPRPLVALLFLLVLCPAAAAQETKLSGAFTLDRQASDDVNRVIEAAVARMSFVTRPTMRGHLRKTNYVYGRVVISQDVRRVSVKFDSRAPMESPANGTPVKWEREDGEKVDLSAKSDGGRLVQTLKGEDYERTNTFSLSADGRTLTLGVVTRNPKLPKPLEYKLVYTRAS